MAESQEPLDGDSVDRLSTSISALSQQVEVLRNVLDEIREDFCWAVRNDRVAIQPQPFILKRMALDPTASDWADRLEIVRGESSLASPARTTADVGDLAAAVDGLTDQTDLVCQELEQLRDRLSESDDEPSTEPIVCELDQTASQSFNDPQDSAQQRSLF